MADRKRAWRVARIIGVWILTTLLVILFVRQGFSKMSSHGGWARAFEHWGYPAWFRVLVGVGELLAAGLLALPRTAKYGAGLVILIMLGGMYTHVSRGEGVAQVRHEVGPLLVASVVLAARWRRSGGSNAGFPAARAREGQMPNQ